MRLTGKMFRKMILQECHLLMEQESSDKPSSDEVMAGLVNMIKATGLSSGHQKTLIGMIKRIPSVADILSKEDMPSSPTELRPAGASPKAHRGERWIGKAGSIKFLIKELMALVNGASSEELAALSEFAKWGIENHREAMLLAIASSDAPSGLRKMFKNIINSVTPEVAAAIIKDLKGWTEELAPWVKKFMNIHNVMAGMLPPDITLGVLAKRTKGFKDFSDFKSMVNGGIDFWKLAKGTGILNEDWNTTTAQLVGYVRGLKKDPDLWKGKLRGASKSMQKFHAKAFRDTRGDIGKLMPMVNALLKMDKYFVESPGRTMNGILIGFIRWYNGLVDEFPEIGDKIQ